MGEVLRTVIVIPARYASTRYAGKSLVGLRDYTGATKSLVQRSWEATMAAAVYVATDDARIAAAAEAFSAQVIMTSEACENGTMCCADTLEHAKFDADLVVNLRGDAPLTLAWFVRDLIGAPEAGVATAVLRCDAETYAHFSADRAADRVGGTTYVFHTQGHALYFSKEVLPYIDPAKAEGVYGSVFLHVGL